MIRTSLKYPMLISWAGIHKKTAMCMAILTLLPLLPTMRNMEKITYPTKYSLSARICMKLLEVQICAHQKVS
ncbi:hypothetical protein D3C75_628930 [compost metagenome]